VIATVTGKYSDPALSLLRIVTGLLFMQHGAQKLFGVLGGFGGQPGATAPLGSLMGLAGILEFFGGLLIAVGLLTRPVAFILAGEMAVAYFMAHLPQGFWPILNQGEVVVLFAFIFLFLAANGGGSISVDGRLRRSGRDATGADRPATVGAR
jgi:putative oxidoreductase